MKKPFLFILALLALVNNSYAAKTVALQNCTVEFCDSITAAKINVISDAYTQAMTPFDFHIRLGKANADESAYLALAATEVTNWSESEAQQLEKSIKEIDSFLKQNHITLSLPRTIQFIKTRGKEEFEAEGYTRGNRVMLCIKPGQLITTHVVAHELFHVYSRSLGAQRDAIYAVFGFRKCNRINTYEAMQHTAITNPDCPFTEHYLRIATTGGSDSADVVLQLYSKRSSYEGFNLASDVDLTLLQVEGPDNKKEPVMKDGKGIRMSFESVPDFFRQVGFNTSYILHPEEIAAEHFAMLIIGEKVQQPEFIERLKQTLQ